jgi:uncharacterized 2Fe-2S/4Fe-4S cluster protein (DUF4445 family)
MPKVTVIYGEKSQTVEAPLGSVLGEAIQASGLPLEQPCAGRGTCGKCKVLCESGVAAPDEIERRHLTPGELALNNRLACRAQIAGDAQVALAPVVVYSNKIFHNSRRYKSSSSPLGLAIDLGSTTVAAFLVMLDTGEAQAGAASLNQQTVYGADVISRLAAALESPLNAERLHKLALASINQAVDSLRLSERVRGRIAQATIVGNVAMHHLLARLPVTSLARMPFQPNQKGAIPEAGGVMDGIFPEHVQVSLPPLIGGFVGSAALACLAYFDFAHAPAPMAAIDLGTNGEVMVTDGKRILVASTAAGPAFEGVNISCGTRAVDGAITNARLEDGKLSLETIANQPAVGLTGSGLLSVVHELRKGGAITVSGRIEPRHPLVTGGADRNEYRRIPLTGDGRLALTQWDIRELQKAKGAIRAAIEILMKKLDLEADDLQRMILTGSFGGQVDLEAGLALGMIPPVRRERVETIANGAGLGAAMFLSEAGMARAIQLAEMSEQVDLDQDPAFIQSYIAAMSLAPN